MEHNDKRQVAGEVFSARIFFEQCSSGVVAPDGRIPFFHEFPAKGVFRPTTNHCSLMWVDGLYGDSLARERFFTSLANGEIPTPISGLVPRVNNPQVRYTSPVALIAAPQTVLSACGLVGPILAVAERSSHIRCTGCNAALTRFSSPLTALDAIANERNGRSVSIFVESNDSRLAEWAASHGLRVTDQSRGLTSVYLDRLEGDMMVSPSLGTLLHSVWRIPNIRLTTCEATPDKPLKCYAPAGWCHACGMTAGPISLSTLRELLTYGQGNSYSGAPEALISLAPSLTVRELLDASPTSASLVANTPLDQACELLTKLSLHSLPLGATTDTLDASDLAKLSIVATTLASTSPSEMAIIDLPSGVIPHSDVAAVQNLLERAGSATSIAVLHDLCTPTEPLLHDIEIKKGSGPELFTVSLSKLSVDTFPALELHRGDLLRIPATRCASHSVFHQVFKEISAVAATTDTSIVVAPIPVFKPLHKSGLVIGEELGLLEPLAQLYASSLDARVHGLTAKDFTLFRTRSPRHICAHCRGLGVVLTLDNELPRPLAECCHVCRGARCKPPVSTALFRGVSFATILNQPIAQSAQTLSALSKARPILDSMVALDLHHLPLGMPVALLSTSEVRRLLAVRALWQARQSKPVVVLFEAPTVALSKPHQEQLARLRDARLADACSVWIEIHQMAPRRSIEGPA